MVLLIVFMPREVKSFSEDATSGQLLADFVGERTSSPAAVAGETLNAEKP